MLPFFTTTEGVPDGYGNLVVLFLIVSTPVLRTVYQNINYFKHEMEKIIMKKHKYLNPREWYIMALRRYRRKQNKHQRTKIGPLSNLSYICLAMSAAREQRKRDVYALAQELYNEATGIIFSGPKYDRMKYPPRKRQ